MIYWTQLNRATMTSTTKEHVKSAGITFITAFAMTIVPYIGTLNAHELKQSTILAIIAAAVRAGIKALVASIQPSK